MLRGTGHGMSGNGHLQAMILVPSDDYISSKVQSRNCCNALKARVVKIFWNMNIKIFWNLLG